MFLRFRILLSVLLHFIRGKGTNCRAIAGISDDILIILIKIIVNNRICLLLWILFLVQRFLVLLI